MEARVHASASREKLIAADRDVRRLSIDTVRCLAMDAVQKADAGHPGTAMALAPLGYTIYKEFLRTNPADTRWPGRDRFVLSCGHACVLQYALLHLTGYDLGMDDLRQFRQWGSRTPGHPERGRTPGIEVTTGPLGQGFANAVGMAMAERFLADHFNRPGHAIVDHHVYVICSDGDMMEGVSQEAASIAGNFALDKLVVCYDDNRITIDGTTALSFDGENHGARMEADGWHVQRVEDSEDLDAVAAALARARDERERPSFISIRSHIAYPAPHAVDTAKAHGSPLGEDEVRATKEVLGFDPDETFVVPEGVYEHMSLRDSGSALQAEWEQRFAAWRDAAPDAAREWDRAWSGRMRDGWREALPQFEAGEELATRAAGNKVMAAISQFAPTMIGGAADLVASTRTVFDGAGEFSRAHAGRNVPFGIREHGMGAIVNGAATHGGIVKPYGSTFLVFSDYMRGAVRLSALMQLPVVWVWTHDSVGLGEDGPTHQPIEHFAALRAIPELWVVRPADAAETVAAWEVALQHDDGPVALLLSRQGTPVLDRAEVAPAGELARGGYVLWEAGATGTANGGSPAQLIMIATGTEVAPTLQAARELHGEGVGVRVVSMPCVELFEAQPDEYREQVLPRAVTTRLAIEPGATLGWWKWVGLDGAVHGLDRFGASAPGKTVLEKFGFDARGIAAAAQRPDRKGDPMSAEGQSPLRRLSEFRQSVWVDFLSRESIRGGHLQSLIDDDAVVGATSNPTIFQKAMTTSDAYDEQISELGGGDAAQIFWALAERDVQDACDVFRPVWDGGGGRDGYVSLEVDPTLAYDTLTSFREAMRLHEQVDRPNLMVKIPGTKPGVAAIEDVIAKGRSINVTLIFSLARYAEVAESYVRGIERLVAEGGDPSKVASVASFFVSRIDTEADRRLDELGGHDELKGRLAIANARLAYAHYKQVFAGPRWDFLVSKGARPQRVLWASTSTKNPDYPDVLYVEELIGPDTVDTMPEETIRAYQDHGQPEARLERDLDAARALLPQLADAGVDYDDVTETLEREGVEKFSDSFAQLLDALAQKLKSPAPA